MQKSFLPAEGQGPEDVEKKPEPLEGASKPMPFLPKFWEMQVCLWTEVVLFL